MELLALICLALIGAIVYLTRQAAQDRKEWALERGALLQRIQAPEVAVQQHVERPQHEPVLPVGVDDDKAYAEARERRLNANAG